MKKDSAQAIQALIQTYSGQDPNSVNGIDVKNYKGHIIIQVSKQFDYDASNGRIRDDRDILIIPGGRVDFLDRFVDSVYPWRKFSLLLIPPRAPLSRDHTQSPLSPWG